MNDVKYENKSFLELLLFNDVYKIVFYFFQNGKTRSGERLTKPKPGSAAHTVTLTRLLHARLCRALLVGCAPSRAEGAMT